MIKSCLTTDLSYIDGKVFAKNVKKYSKLFERYKNLSPLMHFPQIAKELKQEILTHFHKLEELRLEYKDYTALLISTISEDDRQEVILDFIMLIGATDLKGDVKSFSRWFDADVATERYLKKTAFIERELKYLFNRLSYCLLKSIELKPTFHLSSEWKELELKQCFLSAFYYPGEPRVKLYAFEALSNFIGSIPIQDRQISISNEVKQFIIRSAQDTHQSIESQQLALALLIKYSPNQFMSIAQSGLHNEHKDGFFIRAHIARLTTSYWKEINCDDAFLEALTTDCSEYVRQEFYCSLVQVKDSSVLSFALKHIVNEESDKVKASFILALPNAQALHSQENQEIALDFCLAQLDATDDFLVKSLLDTIPALFQRYPTKLRTSRLDKITTQLKDFRAGTDKSSFRKWASQALNYCWLFSDTGRTEAASLIRSKIESLPIGKRKKIKLPILAHLNDKDLGRLMSIINSDNFPANFSRKGTALNLTRWYKFRFRLWRFLHELRNSTTDKRQAHLHMIGRVFDGDIAIPSNVLGEQTETKVPGEPLFVAAEDGPRNYLPLVDELISSLDQNWPIKPLQIFSTDGVTLIKPPRNLWVRLKAKIRLSIYFEEYAYHRNWNSQRQENASHYIGMVRDLGFEVSYKDYTNEQEPQNDVKPHSSISRFFNFSFLPLFGTYWDNIKSYFASVYSNNLKQLMIFLIGLFSLFFIKHAWLNFQVNRARKDLPLSVGGWGTRGKSGTERLKAALFNGLGLNVISKTTGCEAMFLHGVAHGKLKEMFLFRPYDKATIWEQVNLLRLSTQLGADVYLWECMGLTPAYVHILQKHWMRDDYATITNTYPDHEDVQGPAGYDIPKVMVEFIPKNSKLVTSEEVMYPILSHGAKQINTDCYPVTWKQTLAITDDILNRFPYEEHPNNIALVTRMAELMGIEKDFALRNMADHVVLDLGVLKTYPKSHIDLRSVQYVMGNSANERLGAMGNWTRMGFDQHQMDTEAKTWVTTVINNRADRVPRSKVFASMLVKDIAADQHFLIGSNLDGFMKFLKEAWDEHFADYSILGSEERRNDNEQMLHECQAKAKFYRVVFDKKILQARLKVSLMALDIDSEIDYADINENAVETLLAENNKGDYFEDLWKKYIAWQTEFKAYSSVIEQIQNHPKKANSDFINLLQKSLFDRIVIVYDPMTSGEAIVNLIAKETPLGFDNRVMGMQNIKGTGLDFVYRWQAWEACYNSCQKLYSKKQIEVAEGLLELKSFKEFGSLSKSHVEQTLKQVRQLKTMQSDQFQAELIDIEQALHEQMDALAKISTSNQQAGRSNKVYQWLINTIEKIIDISDAVKRRKKANLIYKDMAAQRISQSRAAIELQKLTKRQKGGWLWKSLKEKA